MQITKTKLVTITLAFLMSGCWDDNRAADIADCRHTAQQTHPEPESATLQLLVLQDCMVAKGYEVDVKEIISGDYCANVYPPPQCYLDKRAWWQRYLKSPARG
jgi:hypothetical protein